jgi:hypothetical protein
MHSVVEGSRDYGMPQKVLFKRSEAVVNHRKVALGSFLKRCIDCCSAYGTEEQDLIFRFLNAYENIIHTVELDQDARSVLESLEGAAFFSNHHSQAEEFSVDGSDDQEGQEGNGNGNGNRGGAGGGGGGGGEGEGREGNKEDLNWKTPFAAAVLTAWVVISMMGPATGVM